MVISNSDNGAGRNKCVRLVRGDGLSWSSSENECRETESAVLVNVSDQEEQAALEEIIINRFVRSLLSRYFIHFLSIPDPDVCPR